MRETESRKIGSTSVEVGNPWVFFAVTYAITWTVLLLAIVLGINFQTAEGVVVQLLGLIGPSAAGIGFVYLVYDEEGRADFWNRIKEVSRIGVGWVLVILLVPIVVTVVAGIADFLLEGPGVTWGEVVQETSVNPLAILPALFIATLPPILEELGWRGYALDRLQMDWSALSASLILGVVWAGWHLPLFFIEGSFHREVVGFATVGFWLFMIGIVALSVVFTWVYNHISRSILGIIILHGWVNFVSTTIEVADEFFYPVWVLLAFLVVGIWGPKTLTKRDTVPKPP
ncbi:CPBP family intramembrane glutamic endopeptidase [Halorussus lipolyticus]|uniref:CPBP family intramembrane glutamic endopeptidase n=1 Tax=Halorussus lipolyticus TaxID=3034024 RepID=UPI0023E7CB1F|nr:type II CAAX endopeptidase family protein [Halorussus sp. DT80]